MRIRSFKSSMSYSVCVFLFAFVAASLGEDVVRAAQLKFGTSDADATGDDYLDFANGRAELSFHANSYLEAKDGYVRLVSDTYSRVVSHQNGSAYMKSNSGSESEVVADYDGTAYLRGKIIPGAERAMVAAGSTGNSSLKASTGAEVVVHSDGRAFLQTKDLGSGAKAQVMLDSSTGDGYLKSKADAKFSALGSGSAVVTSSSGAEAGIQSAGGAYLRTKDLGAGATAEVMLDAGTGDAYLKGKDNAKFTAEAGGNATVQSAGAGEAALRNGGGAGITVTAGGDVIVRLGA